MNNGAVSNDSIHAYNLTLLFIACIMILQYCSLSPTKELFTTLNKTLSPKLINNPNAVFNSLSKSKKNIYNSNVNYSDCDETCATIKKELNEQRLANQVKRAEMGLTKWTYEKFNGNECSRPEFLQNEINDTILGKTWNYSHNDCPSIQLNNNSWTLNNSSEVKLNENFDSRIMPVRSLPENTVVEGFVNNNIFLYNTNKCSPKKKNIGFEQVSECCYSKDSKANIFQSMDEKNLSNTMKLLDYASGKLHHDNITDASYSSRYKNIPSLSDACNEDEYLSSLQQAG